MALASSINQGIKLPLSTAFTRPFFVGVTGLTLTLTLSKAGGAFAAAGGAVSEISSGWYKVALTTTDTNTEGAMAYHATDGGTNIVDWCDQVAAPVKLADKVAHGGTPGSSTATLAANLFHVQADTGDAVIFRSTDPGYAGLHAWNTGGYGAKFHGGTGLECQGTSYGLSCDGGIGAGFASGGSDNAGIFIEGGASGPAVQIWGPYTTPGPVIQIDATAALAGLDGGPGIQITTGAGDGIAVTPVAGHGINIAGNGSGKFAVNLSGSNSASASMNGTTKDFTTALTESYAADGATFTPAQALFEICQFLEERSVSGTTMTIKKRDGSTSAYTLTLNSATQPTSTTRAT